jgi:hypothetical protein
MLGFFIVATMFKDLSSYYWRKCTGYDPLVWSMKDLVGAQWLLAAMLVAGREK